jgi:plastocyanin
LRLATIAACVMAALAVAACGSSKSSTSSSSATTSSSSASTTPAAPAAQKSELEMYDYRFDPKTIKGKPGQKVTLELKNEGKTEHNFTVDSQHIDKDVEKGEDAKVTVSLPKSGALHFYCSYHKAKGMAGSLSAGGA